MAVRFSRSIRGWFLAYIFAAAIGGGPTVSAQDCNPGPQNPTCDCGCTNERITVMLGICGCLGWAELYEVDDYVCIEEGCEYCPLCDIRIGGACVPIIA